MHLKKDILVPPLVLPSSLTISRWRGGRRARSSDPRGECGLLVGKLSKEQERWITGRMVEEEIQGSRESGIYSTSSGEDEQDEEIFSPMRGMATPIGELQTPKNWRQNSKILTHLPQEVSWWQSSEEGAQRWACSGNRGQICFLPSVLTIFLALFAKHRGY